MFRESVEKADEIAKKIEKRTEQGADAGEIQKLRIQRAKALGGCSEATPNDCVWLARRIDRPHIEDFIGALFTDFFEQKGDHLYDDDHAMIGGIARFHGIPVSIVGHKKGHSLQENIGCNFGMPKPEGYRKALRIMNQAEKFHRPIITFIDTPGAYPGKDAEEHGQGEAIGRNLAAMSSYHVPVISVVTGEGNSGGALAIGVANRILMMQYAVYSVLSPEGFASILWKDSSKADEAAGMMKLTSSDLLVAGVADEIVPEPVGGAQEDPKNAYSALDRALQKHLSVLMKLSPEELREDRNRKFRNIGCSDLAV
jgi:acetyl-CoA carboxylase carboxyl transferase subunit alpha